MNKSGRSQLALGVILILIGGWFILNQTVPEFKNFFAPYTQWPVNLLLIGAGILLIGLVTGSPGLAVPATIVAGIGGIFYYQEMVGSSESWSYMWALIPGFVGLGVVIQGLLGENTASNLKRGLNLMVISAVIFLIFAAFLGGWTVLGSYGPAVLLILLGVWVLGSGLYRTYRKRMNNMSRGQMFWGTALILFGGLMLAGEMGVSLPNGNSLLSLFWPVFLIGLGVWFLLSVFVRRNVEMEADSIDLQGAAEAKIRINHGAGEFRLHSGASGAELMRGNFAGGLDKKTDRSGDRLEVKMRPADNFIMFPPFGFKEQLDWDVSFNADVSMSLDMNLGANKSVIDLQDMKITGLKLKSGASDTVVTLPAHGRLNVNCEVGAASLVLIVPEGVAIRTHATVGAGEFRVDKTRFPNGESPDFTTAENAADIRVTGGAASIRVK